MTPEVIQAIHQFMQRVQLTGGEVPAYTKCMEALQTEFTRLSTPPAQEGAQVESE